MRYFEYTDEKSNKFWQIEVQDCDVITCYGKVGSAGRESTKSHDTAELAQASAKKLIAQKVKKGYVEAQETQNKTPNAISKKDPNQSLKQASVQLKAQSKKTSKKASTEAIQSNDQTNNKNKNTPNDKDTPTITDAQFCSLPSEKAHWNSDFDHHLPVMRGIKTGTITKLKLSVLTKKYKDAIPLKWRDFTQQIETLKDNKISPNQKHLFSTDSTETKNSDVKNIVTKSQCVDFMIFCMLAKDWSFRLGYRKTLDWFVKTLIYDLGIADALTLFLETYHTYNENHDCYYVGEVLIDALTTLRKHVAYADEESYQMLKQIAQPYQGNNYRLSLVSGFIFAHEQEWTNAIDVSYPLDNIRDGVFYQPKKLLKSAHNHYDFTLKAPQMMMSIRLYGLEFLTILDEVLAELTTAKRNQKSLEQLISAVTMLDSKQTLQTLIKYCEHGTVLAGIEAFAEMHPVYAFDTLLAHHKKDPIKRMLVGLLSKHKDWQQRLNQHCHTDGQQILNKLLEKQVNVQDANTAELPEIFKNPPWQVKHKKLTPPTSDIVLSFAELADDLNSVELNSIELNNVDLNTDIQVTQQIHWQANDKAKALADNTKKSALEYINANHISEYLSPRTQQKLADNKDRWTDLHILVLHCCIKIDYVDDVVNTRKVNTSMFWDTLPTYFGWQIIEMIACLPVDIQAEYVQNAPTRFSESINYYYDDNKLLNLIAREELDSIPCLMALAKRMNKNQFYGVVDMIESPAMCAVWLDALSLKSQLNDAMYWFNRFSKTAIIGLIPIIFNPVTDSQTSSTDTKTLKKRKQSALHILQYLAENGHTDTIKAVVAGYQHQIDKKTGKQAGTIANKNKATGKNSLAFITKLLATPSWHQLPKAVPKTGFMPDFLNLSILPRPLLKPIEQDSANNPKDESLQSKNPKTENLANQSLKALPIAHMETACNILALSDPDMPYAGVQLLKAHFTAESLATFSWAIFEIWHSANMPSKYSWMYTQLGLLGDDDIARKLTPLIREMPGQSAHANAVKGLGILKGIGSDVALMHLNGIAQKVKFKGLKDNAKEQIARIAKDRGFSPAQLADRLVPDLGLDARGQLLLDFGNCTFTASFDEHLKPVLKNEDGKRLKNLPKPNQKDDADKASIATKAFKALKKDARAIASIQLKRLELAMCLQRRWAYEEFDMLFVQHPFIRHLTQRLVWAVYDAENTLIHAFRVAEDLSFTDQEDDEFDLPAIMAQTDNTSATIGIAHVLELNDAQITGFGGLFSDYQILQPFEQLGRQTFALTDAEISSNTITRFASQNYASRALMGLTNYGWERGEPMDAGWIGEFLKTLANGNDVSLVMDPGMVAGDLDWEETQKITEISVRKAGGWFYSSKNEMIQLAELNPIEISEILRDVNMINPLDEA